MSQWTGESMAELEDFTNKIGLKNSMFFMMHDDNGTEMYVLGGSGPILQLMVDHGHWVSRTDDQVTVSAGQPHCTVLPQLIDALECHDCRTDDELIAEAKELL